jgi:hypothetical protein
MSKILKENINRVKTLMKINEESVDIDGIDELVYNPLTKRGGEIGHGYDRGKRVDGITWDGHDNHLHLAFTKKDVAMIVINKADEMGLKTTENPYAKKDPNNKVDLVHTNGSFHYRTFPGEPKVGMGVDISGDKDKIKELINWIESKYAQGTYDYSTQSDEQKQLNNIMNQEYDGKKVKDLINVEPNYLEMISNMLKFFS